MTAPLPVGSGPRGFERGHRPESVRQLFHVHVDGEYVAPDLAARLVADHGFALDDFSANADGSRSYAPQQHITFKTRSSRAFKAQFEAVRSLAAAKGAFRGYLEGEFLAVDLKLPDTPYDPGVTTPIQLCCVENVDGVVRESEIHISMSVARSDPRLRASLQAMGFFLASLEKADGPAHIYTVQGDRARIAAALGPVIDYLRAAGGHGGASVKEERIARWWQSHDDIALPPLLERVAFLNTSTAAA